VPPEIPQFFVRTAGGRPQYEPVVLGAAEVAFSDAKHGVSEQRDVLYAAPISDGAVAVDWDRAEPLDVDSADLGKEPAEGASFEGVPAAALVPKNYAAWGKAFKSFVGQAEQVELLFDRELKLTSKVGESERDFRIRVLDAQRQARDRAVEALRKKYGSSQARIADQLRRAETAVERETQQASQARLQTTVSMGATLLGALFGRKVASTGTLGRATTAARGMGRSMKEAEDIKRATENLEALRERERALEQEIEHEVQAITDRFTGERELERFALAPKRGQVTVQFVALGWVARQERP
jgi:hypothetical protein